MENKNAHTLLLVDDDQFLLNMYSSKFSKSGFVVTTVTTPTEALSKIREGAPPDVIILDIIMPGMDGLQLLETMRKEKLAPNAAVIMLTNQSDGIDRAKALHVDGYIVKATTIPSEVVSEVEAILAKRA